MDPLESSAWSEPERPPHLSSTTIPDLTDRIIRPDDQYCVAGGFGDVFRCRYKSEDGVKEVAVKAFRFHFSIDGNNCDEEKAARRIRRELGIWGRLDHRNIVPFLGITYGFGKLGNVALVSTWMPHGSLHTFLDAHDERLLTVHRLQLLLDIANGLHYLHSFPMVHGDLSSNNVLVDHNYNARLTDFGCASLAGELPEGLTYLKMTTLRPGTLRWAAPEHLVLKEGETKHTMESDIYSFGNITFLVLSGKDPWSEVQADVAVVFRLSQGLKPSRPLSRSIDDQHWAFIERCWSSVPERPFTEDVVSSLRQLLVVYPRSPSLRDLLGGARDGSGNDGLEEGAVPIRRETSPGLQETQETQPVVFSFLRKMPVIFLACGYILIVLGICFAFPKEVASISLFLIVSLASLFGTTLTTQKETVLYRAVLIATVAFSVLVFVI